MRLKDYRRSGNVEDRRGMSIGGRGAAIGGGGFVLVLLLSLLTGQNPLTLLEQVEQVGGAGDGAPQTGQVGVPEDQMGQFASTVLASTEDVWGQLLNGRYEAPRLVLFSGAVQSACGTASAAVGPFYCPGDSQVYLDLSFFDQLSQRFGASGDFAQAYVIAHEVGHHVQNLLGIAGQIDQARRGASESEANALSVQMELQADCFAGVWGYHAGQANLIEPGDFEEGLNAAAAIGDDTLQKRSQGYTVPETWTHGSSAMRVKWLRRGLESGDPAQCDVSERNGA